MAEDFSGKNLRGRSFKGQDLTDANFSYADIRGANFTNAILRGANFSHTKGGLQRRWAIALLTVSLLILTLLGYIEAFPGVITGAALIDKDPSIVFAGVVILLTLTLFFIVSIRQGLVVALGSVTVAVAVTVVATMAVARAATGNLTAVSTMAVAVTAIVATTATVTVARTIGGAVTAVGAMAVSVAVSGNVTMVSINKGVTAARTVAIVVALALASLCAYASWRTLAGDEKYVLVRKLAVAFAAIGGTSFRGASLTDADFTQATLKNTDFRRANVTRTCWLQAKKLDRARVGGTYLENLQVRQLVTTGEVQKKNFDRKNLQGINLRKAKLVDASFIGANLNQANVLSVND